MLAQSRRRGTVLAPVVGLSLGLGAWAVAERVSAAQPQTVPEGGPLPDAAREWVTDYGYQGYGGPCPPPGPAHHYVLTVHALPHEKLPVPDEATSAQVRFTILANETASASITGLFALPEDAA